MTGTHRTTPGGGTQAGRTGPSRGVWAGASKMKGTRLGPRSIAAHRKRLKLSRKDFGTLAGVSANTIYLWETGEVSPKEKSRAVLVGLREIGAREAKRLLATEK